MNFELITKLVENSIILSKIEGRVILYNSSILRFSLVKKSTVNFKLIAKVIKN